LTRRSRGPEGNDPYDDRLFADALVAARRKRADL
jgi:hypothetical protein